MQWRWQRRSHLPHMRTAPASVTKAECEAPALTCPQGGWWRRRRREVEVEAEVVEGKVEAVEAVGRLAGYHLHDDGTAETRDRPRQQAAVSPPKPKA